MFYEINTTYKTHVVFTFEFETINVFHSNYIQPYGLVKKKLVSNIG